MGAILDEVECGDLRCNNLTVTGAILVAGGVSGGVNVQDEGVPLAGNPHTALNFVGSTVQATDSGGGLATITVTGGIVVADEGVPLSGTRTQVNFVGTGVTATDGGAGVATVTIPAPIAGSFQQVGTALTILAQTGQFSNPQFLADGVYTVDLPVIAGVTTPEQVFPHVTGRAAAPVIGVTQVNFAAGHATILISLFSDFGAAVTDPFTLTVTTV